MQVPFESGEKKLESAFSLCKRLSHDFFLIKLLAYANIIQKGEFTMTLAELEIGKEAIIVSVGGEGALRRRLLDMGLTPRTCVKIEKIAPMGDPLEMTVRGYSLTLRKEDAAKIEIEVIEA